MTSFSWRRICLAGFIAGGLVSSSVPAEETPLFAVKYTARGVEFSGRVDSEDNGQALAASVKAVRPDLPILNQGLSVDPEIDIPKLADLKAILAEIGISTHEGGIAIWEDEVLLTGMTDSVISLTALKLRAEPILGNKQLVDRICIVSSADLPDLSIKLATGEETGPLLDFEEYPTAAEQFEPPGISMAKLLPTLLMLSDLGRLSDSSEVNADDTIRAIPLVTSLQHANQEGGMPLRAIPAEPQPTRVQLESIRFSRNAFLLQANQEQIIETIVKQVSEPPLAGHPILLKPVLAKGGSEAYMAYLAEQRGEKVRKILSDRGISPSRLSIRNEAYAAAADDGEVRLVVEIPPPEPEAAEEKTVVLPPEEDADEAGASPPDSSEPAPPEAPLLQPEEQ